MKQSEQVLQYLEKHGTITALDAIKELGIIQLPARISQLRCEGYTISTVYKRSVNRDGEQVRYGVYRLEK